MFAAGVCLVFIGGFYVLVKLIAFIKLVLDLHVNEGMRLSCFKVDNASGWAVVTGATDGIGLEFAKQLAKNGFNIILVSRSNEKLLKTKSLIESDYRVQTKTFEIDFSNNKHDLFENLVEFCKSVDTTILINNVGTNHSFPVPFEEESRDLVNRIIQVNITNTTNLTHQLIPIIKESYIKNKTNYALLLNVGSFAGVVPTAYLSTYSASKSFLRTFTQSIGEENADQSRFIVQYLDVYYVISNMSKIRKEKLMVPTPEKYVHSVLAKINLKWTSKSMHCLNAYWPHAYLAFFIDALPLTPVMAYTTRMQYATRLKALKKIRMKK